MWGIVPAAGSGSRMQPLAFSKELLPVGSRLDAGVERPRAVSEYLLERMIRGGARKICFVISPGKTDIMEYYGGEIGPAHVSYVVQPRPAGLCDAIFRTLPLIPADEPVMIGLPDTIWFPEDGLARLEDGVLSFLLFPVDKPEFFDAVVTDPAGNVLEVQVKRSDASSRWIWGAFKMPGAVLRSLHDLWRSRGMRDEYMGTLVNAWLAQGGRARATVRGRAYVDVGTLHGYREAIELLRSDPEGTGLRGGQPPAGRGEDHGSAGRAAPGTEPAVAAPRPLKPRPAPVYGPGLSTPRYTQEEIRRRVRALGPWFHNLNLQGVETAPDHFLGDFPMVKWRRFAHAIPENLAGMSVLDIGCNAGFHSIEMKRRGAARVVGIDTDPDYLAQARFAAEVCGVDLELVRMSVYQVAELRERFDLVLFMGVFYHLRHPLLALELVAEHTVGGLLVFQSMLRGSPQSGGILEDYPFSETEVFNRAEYPRLHFVENLYAGDTTNWWIPNRACAEAMLRSTGFRILQTPEPEVFICDRQPGAMAAPEEAERVMAAAIPVEAGVGGGAGRRVEPGSAGDLSSGSADDDATQGRSAA